MTDKRLLRKKIGLILRNVSSQEIERQSRNITNSVIPLLRTCRSVACYMSMESGEVATQYLLKHLFDEGKTVYLPRCTSTEETGHVVLREPKRNYPHLTFHKMQSWQQIQELKPQGKYRLREPAREHPDPLPAQLDVVLVPGVAFSLKNGGRLGHGGGYYDDFFRRYKLQHNGGKPLLIGLSLNEQIVEGIDLEIHDQKMDCIVTGDGDIRWVELPK
ncbi:hypothetical protein HG535_0H04290 [Zygotorulaspora mrakii]|uniref:5-formyltetrahydrofolate cyclo-ligase n=1 Tax=Zygotorulaspora mrakii TaxID=42260 RepID=A0A7H9BBG4_ZYGMR|nr:uncharacterized protein HG535_0H04290 [Zygotorulaspora mrakii]QLG75102.1 hypothetical protein HG535_0H04290 [Zygotorulaspora mrakii]